jgi:hypothetical protein
VLKTFATRIRRLIHPVPEFHYGAALDAWTQLLGRDGALLWLEAIKNRDAALS